MPITADEVAQLAQQVLGISYKASLQRIQGFSSLVTALQYLREHHNLRDNVAANIDAARAVLERDGMEASLPEEIPQVPNARGAAPVEVKVPSASVSHAGPGIFALQRKNAPTTIGPYGARQINRKYRRVATVPRGNPKYRTAFNVGKETTPIPFYPFHPNAVFQELFPNGICYGQPAHTAAWDVGSLHFTDANALRHTTALCQCNETEQLYANDPTAVPESTAVAPSAFDWDAGEVPTVYIEEVGIRGIITGGSGGNFSCRLLIFEILDDYTTQRQQSRNVECAPDTCYKLSDFFMYPANTTLTAAGKNRRYCITQPMRGNIAYESPIALKETPIKFKVLADQVFTLPIDSADTLQTDRPFEFKYRPGKVQLIPAHSTNVQNYYQLHGSGRIIWGLYVQCGDSDTKWEDYGSVSGAATALPAYYGSFKMKWRVLTPD